jgi:hypothetical protein
MPSDPESGQPDSEVTSTKSSEAEVTATHDSTPVLPRAPDRSRWRTVLQRLGWIFGAPLPAGDQAPEAALSDDGSNSDADYNVLSRRGPPGAFRRLLRPGWPLERYRRLEEWSWRASDRRFQNLAWLLHAKHEEAVLRARGVGFIGFCLNVVGAFLAVASGAGAVAGWCTIVSFVSFDARTGERHVPDRLWIVVVATTGAVLLIGGAATLLFNVAKHFYDRSARYDAEADFTRNVEAAIRITIAARDARPGAIRDTALDQLAAGLMQRPESEKADADADLGSTLSTAVSELREVVDLLNKVRP